MRHGLTDKFRPCRIIFDMISRVMSSTRRRTMVQNKLILGHQILRCLMSLGLRDKANERTSQRSGVRKQSEQDGASERVSGASK